MASDSFLFEISLGIPFALIIKVFFSQKTGNNMLKKFMSALTVFVFIIGCTQFLDEDNVAETNYTGNDGCVDCHTNKDRLAVLAVAEETSNAGGG